MHYSAEGSVNFEHTNQSRRLGRPCARPPIVWLSIGYRWPPASTPLWGSNLSPEGLTVMHTSADAANNDSVYSQRTRCLSPWHRANFSSWRIGVPVPSLQPVTSWFPAARWFLFEMTAVSCDATLLCWRPICCALKKGWKLDSSKVLEVYCFGTIPSIP